MSSTNRRYLRAAPFEGAGAKTADILHASAMRIGLPPRIEPLAVLYRDSTYMPDGLLVRTGTGILAHWTGSGLRSLDQRKATAALDYLARQEAKNAD